MASGAILGICPVCNEHIWEDQWDIEGETIIHEECKSRFIEDSMKITNGQFKKLTKENYIQKQIEDFRTDLKNTLKYYTDEINRLERMLKSNE